jgi:pimeloyl-ACP methyl ester carboxylesterase
MPSPNVDPVDHGSRDRDARPVAWREAGAADGELVVMFHGLGGSRIGWEPQLASLSAAGYLAAAWDMPGYGASTPPREWTFTALATAAATWIRGFGVEAAHVVGLSMGGMVALHLALAEPSLIRSLVLCDTSPAFGFDGSIDAETWTDARLAPIHAGATPASMAAGVLPAIMAPDAPVTAVDEAVAAMARVGPTAFEAAVRCLPSHDVRPRLAEITAPTLVVVGALDRETPPTYARHLADRIAASRYVEIDGAGHISNLERPAEFNAALLDFLAAVDGRSVRV